MACKPTRVEHCDFQGGQFGDLAWRVMCEVLPGRWCSASIEFDTEEEALAAEMVIRGGCDSHAEWRGLNADFEPRREEDGRMKIFWRVVNRLSRGEAVGYRLCHYFVAPRVVMGDPGAATEAGRANSLVRGHNCGSPAVRGTRYCVHHRE